MQTQFLIGAVTVLASVIVHVGALVILAGLLRHSGRRLELLGRHGAAIFLVAVTVLAVFVMHAAEAFAWAQLFIALGEFEALEEALYFSTVTATTLGYGDVTLSEKWRLLGAFEAMGGLILFAVSTAFLIQVVRAALEYDAAGD